MTINKDVLYRVALWFIVFFLLGAFSGGHIGWHIISWKLSSAAKLGGIIIADQVYDLKPRI